VGVRLLAAAAALGVVGWVTTDAEVSAQSKSHHHPHLHRALQELRQAHHNLKAANGNFGGHRAEALRDVDSAIRQVERAMHHSQPNGGKRTTGVGGTGTNTGTNPSPGRTTTKGIGTTSAGPGRTPITVGTTSTNPTRGSKNGVIIIPQK
jgi:hypothetical protein